MAEKFESPTNKEVIPKEIENRYIVWQVPEYIDLAQMRRAKIHQGYLAIEDSIAVRIRSKDDSFFITWKSKTSDYDAEKDEIEVDLSGEQFKKLWPASDGRRLEKTRHFIPYLDNLVIELDVFEGRNAGNMIAEIEFKSRKLADSFQPPSWFGPEVTALKQYGNAAIAEHGFPKYFLPPT